jgi:hypothetical protein
MENNAMPKRMIKGKLYSIRRKGRPRMRWQDDVQSDLKKMRDRERWRLVVDRAKAQSEL